jgi:signal transduction histidine kinase
VALGICSVRPAKVFRTTTFRLSAVYVLSFAASVAALGVITYLATAITLERRLDQRIEGEMTALQAAYSGSGIAGLTSALKARERTHGGTFDYLLLGPRGERLAGHLAKKPTRNGWSNLGYTESDGDTSQVRILTTALSGGFRLVVAGNRDQVEEVTQTIFDGFLSAFGAVVVLGIAGGVALSFAFLKRVETIRRTAEAIIAGDLSQRIPVRGTGDDLDRLSDTLNRMLDRISELMESLRHISADIAHDLKTPLALLRQRLEAAQTHAQSAAEQNVAIEAAIVHIDEILTTFGALLRIAQIEAGTRRSGFRELNLSAVFGDVTDAFAPAAEDAGKHLEAKIKPAICISGDGELLTQMLANLIDNAIRHTPAGTHIEVSLGSDRDRVVGMVTDDGPGAPAEERERIFGRFYRLEHSRSTPGSGLGLSLVKAVADLHGIVLEVRDAEPGFQIIMRFPEGQQGGATPADRSTQSDRSAMQERT